MNQQKSLKGLNMIILFICKNQKKNQFQPTHQFFNVLSCLQQIFLSPFFRLVDNLPVATRILNPDTMELQFEHGYRLGQVVGNNVYINNHLKLLLSYHMHSK